MTYLRVVSCGLIAGMQKSEIDRIAPGKVLTLYEYRRRYDQATRFGIRM